MDEVISNSIDFKSLSVEDLQELKVKIDNEIKKRKKMERIHNWMVEVYSSVPVSPEIRRRYFSTLEAALKYINNYLKIYVKVYHAEDGRWQLIIEEKTAFKVEMEEMPCG